MCGIAGIARPRGAADVEPAEIRRLCDSIRHRGPDDEGIFVSGGFGMGMRRLSIIDLAGGHQPIFNEDESIAVVMNGGPGTVHAPRAFEAFQEFANK